jgi:hypothetical protein
VLSTLLCTGVLYAHHSQSMFAATPVWVKGTVVRVHAVNPHAFFELESTGPDGRLQRNTIEGPSLNRLARLQLDADFIKVGDVVESCAFPFKEEFRARNAELAASGVAVAELHGQILKMPDGRLQSWGPYGKLQNCLRADDEPQTWADFINAQPAAHDAWCGGKKLVNLESLPPQGAIDAIDRRLDAPCD